VYRRLPSPLHAARAAVGALWASALVLATILIYHPLALATIGCAVLLAAAASGTGRALIGPLRFALWAGLPIVVINVLVSREGLTVFWRLGDLGPFGQGNLTVEALVYGLVIALKVTDLILICMFASLVIDPDELLGVCMKVSFRSALTASLALRMVPLLATDAQRLAEAQRTRPNPVTGMRGRALLLGASVGGALDRSLDVAATLELRGLSGARRVRGLRRPLSRHDAAFLCSAAAICALAIAAGATGALRFHPYPRLHLAGSPATVLICLALAVVTLLPFLDGRGVRR
jgi:energy-coupling factor transport system permease protein